MSSTITVPEARAHAAAPGTTPHRWLLPTEAHPTPHISFGADYNPDQWPREVWAEDVELMREAGVTIVSLAIFSWARIQTGPDTWDIEWLDDVMDLLHAGGIQVDLATATASPPPWLTTLHPEILPVTRTGETLWPGARQHWRPTSPVFREHALRLVEVLAQRYKDHPALVAWHVSNELGCHNAYDYSEDAAASFRTWLTDRYGDVDALNDAWGTAFWSQRYTSLEEVLPPRLAASYPNPTQQLDFKRFSSDALQGYLRAEREILARITPDVPVTTNFMVMGETSAQDYPAWASDVDFVSNDHYVHPGPQSHAELSFSASFTGKIAGRRPWYLMEHSTSAVNWQPVNLAKRAGQMARDSLTHVAHGADAVCYFQWRQSVAGAEKYHSGMVPHAGRDSRLFREVVRLGRTLEALAPVAGSAQLPARVAILQDHDSWWASELDSHPTQLLRYRQEALDWYAALRELGVRADVVPAATDLDVYDVVVAPVLHVVPAALRARLEAVVARGGHLVATYFSGIVDADDHVVPGGYPGALRDLLGVRVEEFSPLLDGDTVTLSDGGTGTLWTEPVDVVGPDVDVLVTYTSGDVAGSPAVTRRTHPGGGSATYVSTRLGQAGVGRLLERLLPLVDVTSELPAALRGRVELAVRAHDDAELWFLVNLTDDDVPLTADGTPLLDGTHLLDGSGDPATDARPTHLAPRAVTVLRRTRRA
ncbi:beta-galactosidase [Flavimobilis sp. GY10621]|uniref:Beta-galactosidase n=1 Tax=Flavimobilis rhizosphaerae TaxID=2775421 RepID=A0ABR9DN64_9MICO|nr:beta-galactosidase [Flavimobilis rhizosphaerae]MBD9698572.1 beta-galactosidase [Flavimobilis rhizosphaerae]